MRPEAAYAKNPITHAITRIIAIMYNKFLIAKKLE